MNKETNVFMLKDFFSLFFQRLYFINQYLNTQSLVIFKNENLKKINSKAHDFFFSQYRLKKTNSGFLLNCFIMYFEYFFFLVYTKIISSKNRYLFYRNEEIMKNNNKILYENFLPLIEKNDTKVGVMKKFFLNNNKTIKSKNLRQFRNTKNRKKKIQISSIDIVNQKFLLKQLNNISYKNSLKGFDREAIKTISILANSYLKTLIIDLAKNSIIRQKNLKNFIKDYGISNMEYCKNNLRMKNSIENKENSFSNVLVKEIRYYKKKEIKFDSLTSTEKIKDLRNEKNTRSDDKLKKQIAIEDSIERTNKTLLALLSGIFQKRASVLKEATKCLCKYKPLQVQMSSKKNQEKVTPFEMDNAQGNALDKDDIDRKFSITGIDCINLMKCDDRYRNHDLILKMMFIVNFDYNLRFKDDNN
jgi:hypothetical protein